ncbi:WGR domain-containing protein [Rhizobium leguminosarum bv. viciae]|uniref:WGR domain-containing protein n=1 Tax=Rhizobium leguminosarum bv. viciae TaxID=387 RepID=A0A8I2KIS6_RHILV|nr:WGR domain-containing protein [Rhizobium leguminosarum]MBY5754891.1 WGR domain-containing protein [Rhizobium leguminosarum]MBY5790664.1 WGR domain-containing protein [Rhizobium leguminosarum]MBY5821559.1 WGR domain-containing protein [Rhizobium leguminosarum]NKM46021.1 WGR domain-containing protein [Rhizobium leguminosarum bv. viciae]TBY71515.1 WGR domain-containing protein [Rhizobium leguminosarum bv. viciae]
MDAKAKITLLYRIDPALNMARFYHLSIQPTLFGGSSLVRNWGRIGTMGQQKVELFDTPGEAAAAHERMAGRKLRRGYRHESTACATQRIVTPQGAAEFRGAGDAGGIEPYAVYMRPVAWEFPRSTSGQLQCLSER